MISMVFGDDEHIAQDGPYSRVMKTRKWLYLSSVLTIALEQSSFNEKAANELVKVFTFTKHQLEVAAGAALVYMLVQFFLLIWQLTTSYDIILSERLAYRRADELAKSADAIAGAEKKRDEVAERISADRQAVIKRFRDAERRLLSARSALGERAASTFEIGSAVDKLRATGLKQQAEIELRDAESELTEAAKAADHVDQTEELARSTLFHAAQQAVLAAESAHRQILSANPSNRPGFSLAETIIDIWRIIPPVLLSLAALLFLLGLI